MEYKSTMYLRGWQPYSFETVQAVRSLRDELGLQPTGGIPDIRSECGWLNSFDSPRELTKEECEVLYLEPL
jgi:hypothetical protein